MLTVLLMILHWYFKLCLIKNQQLLTSIYINDSIVLLSFSNSFQVHITGVLTLFVHHWLFVMVLNTFSSKTFSKNRLYSGWFHAFYDSLFIANITELQLQTKQNLEIQSQLQFLHLNSEGYVNNININTFFYMTLIELEFLHLMTD